jgi:uncharacterized membrane-anchored protein YhcB (DUF1043 family)
LVFGAVISALAYRLLSSSNDKIKSELNSTKNELDEYKANVNQHFDKTSELVSDLTQYYVKVYQHLMEGALNLGDSKALKSLQEHHQGNVSSAIGNENNVTNEPNSHAINRSDEVSDTPAEIIAQHAKPFMGEDVNVSGSSSLNGGGNSQKDFETPVPETQTVKVNSKSRNTTY